MAPALIALSASLEILGPGGGPHTLPLESFFVTPRQRPYHENILEVGEVITRVYVPRPVAGSRQVFLKASVRRAYEFSFCAVAVAAELKDATCVGCRVVLGGVAPRPYRASSAEASLTGKVLTAANIERAASAAVQDAKPMSMNAYKVDLARNLIQRALEQASSGPGETK